MTEAVYTPAQVADHCHCSTKTIMRAIHAGDLEASQLGQRGTWVIREHAIQEWFDRRSNRTRPPRPVADVARVEPQTPNRTERARGRRYGDGSGRVAA